MAINYYLQIHIYILNNSFVAYSSKNIQTQLKTPAIPVSFKGSREKDGSYGKPFVIRTREWC